MEIFQQVHTHVYSHHFIFSHNKCYSYYYYITDIDATKPVHSDSDSSDLPDIPPPDQRARPLCQSPRKRARSDQSPAQPRTPLKHSPKKNPHTITPSTSQTQFLR